MNEILTCTTLSLLPILSTIFIYLLIKFPLKSISEQLKKIIAGAIYGVCIIGQILLSFEISFIAITPLSATIIAIGLIFGISTIFVAGGLGISYLCLSFIWTDASTQAFIFLGEIVGISALSILYLKMVSSVAKVKWTSFLFCGLGFSMLFFLIETTINYHDIMLTYANVWMPFLLVILLNCFVAISMWAIDWLFNEDHRMIKQKKTLSMVFQMILSISICLAFFVAIAVNYSFTTHTAEKKAVDLIERYSMPTKIDVLYETDDSVIDFSDEFFNSILSMIRAGTISNEEIIKKVQQTIKYSYFFSNVLVVDRSGNIIYSVFPESVNKNIFGYESLQCFAPLLNKEIDCYITDKWANDEIIESTNSVKYVGQGLTEEYVLIYSVDKRAYNQLFKKQALQFQEIRLVGKNGGILFVDADGNIITVDKSSLSFIIDDESTPLDIDVDLSNIEYHTLLPAKLYGKNVLFECEQVDFYEYKILTYLPLEEVYFERDIAIVVNISFLIIIFLMLFILIYMLIQSIIVKKITKINESLNQIQKGNLDTKIDELSLAEFDVLSNGINSTVLSLKGYIDAEKNRLHEELALARLIQQSVLPAQFELENKSVELFAKMLPSKEVGGDFFDYYFLSKNKLAFVIADVSGKGIPGAMFMMQSKAMLKDFATNNMEPNEILNKTNNALCANNSSQMFVTAWFGVIDTESGILEFANAGHNPPLLCDENGINILKSNPNFVLAGMENYVYKKEQIILKENDLLFLYTDGITDAQNMQAEFYGINNLKSILADYKNLSPKLLCEQVLDDVGKFSNNSTQFDDETVLAIKFIGKQPINKITIPTNLEKLQDIHNFIDMQTNGMDIPTNFQNKLKIIVDEIASNIIKFSQSKTMELSMNKNKNGIELCFVDFGLPFNPLTQKEADTTLSSSEREIGGLGIHIVKKMADDINYKYESQKNILKIIKKY